MKTDCNDTVETPVLWHDKKKIELVLKAFCFLGFPRCINYVSQKQEASCEQTSESANLIGLAAWMKIF